MQAANGSSINQPFQRNNVINMKSFRASSVDRKKVVWGNPNRRSILHVLAPVVFSGGAVGHGCPDQAPSRVNFDFPQIVRSLFLQFPALNKSRIGSDFVPSPRIHIVSVLAKVFRGTSLDIDKTAKLAFMRNGIALFVVIGAGFINTAYGANFGSEWFWAAHDRDIIAEQGDVKQGENGETPERPIPCQATAPQRAVEGVTTRFRAKAVTNPRAPCPTALVGDEIVCSAWEHAGASDKEPGTKTSRTTIQNRSGVLADNVTNNNALLKVLKARGNVKPFGGGNVIMQEIKYADATTINANSYSGYEVINISTNSPISSASFPISQYAAAVTISGLEVLQNSGDQAIIDLMEGRVEVAEAELANRVDYDLYQDGTGNSSKNLIGLAAAVPNDPTSGTYGGISRGTWNFWRSQYYRGVTDGGAAVSQANIIQYMTTLGLRCVRGSDMPDLWVGDNTYYGLYVNALQAIQRITSDSEGSAGFSGLMFSGGGMRAKVVLGGGISGAVSSTQSTSGATSAHMWALNTKYLMFRPHKDRNFVPIGGDRQSVNQDAIVKLIGWAGNLTSNGPQFSGVLIA